MLELGPHNLKISMEMSQSWDRLKMLRNISVNLRDYSIEFKNYFKHIM